MSHTDRRGPDDDNPEVVTAPTLFDLRTLIGGLFVLYGILLTIVGIFDTPEEIAKAKRLIADLRLPDDEVRTRRFLPHPHGRRIDPRRTFRRSLRAGGAIIDLAFRSPKTRQLRPRPFDARAFRWPRNPASPVPLPIRMILPAKAAFSDTR